MKKLTGFTIVELAIVIVVIGIIASITFVGYNYAIRSAQDAAIKESVDSAGGALQEYLLRTESERSSITSFDSIMPTLKSDDYLPSDFGENIAEYPPIRDSYSSSPIYYLACIDKDSFILLSSLHDDDNGTYDVARLVDCTGVPSGHYLPEGYNYADEFVF